MSFETTATCSYCGCSIQVNKAAFEHEHAVLALCNHCAKDAPDVCRNETDGNHSVVGIRISPPEYPVTRHTATRCPFCFTDTKDGIFRCCETGKKFN